MHLLRTDLGTPSVLFPTAFVSVHNAAFLWVMAWIAQNPSAQKQIGDFQLSTSEWRQVRSRSGNALRASEGAKTPAPGSSQEVGEQNVTWSAKDIIGQELPVYRELRSLQERKTKAVIADCSILIKHNGNYLWITRKMKNFARTEVRTVDHLQIRQASSFFIVTGR